MILQDTYVISNQLAAAWDWTGWPQPAGWQQPATTGQKALSSDLTSRPRPASTGHTPQLVKQRCLSI